jgi:hypothetical protein
MLSAAVSWLFFKARAKSRYLNHNGRASNTEKQPTGRGPEGCVENGPTVALLVGYVSIQICSLLAPCRRPILNATICQLHMRRRTSILSRPVPGAISRSNPSRTAPFKSIRLVTIRSTGSIPLEISPITRGYE